MPSSSSFCAMSSLSSTENETDSPWVPSRSVVSNVEIFMTHRLFGALRHPYLLALFEKRHHAAQFAAHFFDGLMARRFPRRQEVFPPRLVLFHPLPREISGLKFRQDLAHIGAGLLIDRKS